MGHHPITQTTSSAGIQPLTIGLIIIGLVILAYILYKFFKD